MLMERDAIELMQETACNAASPQVIEAASDPRRVRVAIRGAVETLDRDAAPRSHHLASLGDVIEMAKFYKAQEAEHRVVLWHGPSEVVMIFDDDERLDRATFRLERSRQYIHLFSLAAKATPLDQAAFVKLLRLEMGMDQTLIAPFRRLDWTSGNTASGSIERGADRMGRSITAECQGIDRLPEELLIPGPVYVTPSVDWEVSVRCMVEVDAMAQRIILRPFPGEVEHAEWIAQEKIHESLLEAEVPVYYGSS